MDITRPRPDGGVVVCYVKCRRPPNVFAVKPNISSKKVWEDDAAAIAEVVNLIKQLFHPRLLENSYIAVIEIFGVDAMATS